MSGTTTQANGATSVANETPAHIEPHDPVFVQSKWGAVAVYGHEGVSKKDLLILQSMLNLPLFDVVDHGVRAIVFRVDGRPVDLGVKVLGLADPESACISINLMEMVSRAVTEALDSKYNVAIQTVYHHLLLTTLLHEINHINLMAWDQEASDLRWGDTAKEFNKQMESTATDWSLETLTQMAKTMDIEPEHISGSRFLSTQVMELLGADDDDALVKTQRWMLENHIMYHQPATESHKAYSIHSFREFVRDTTGDAADDPAWANAPVAESVPANTPTVAEQLNDQTKVELSPVAQELGETHTTHTEVYSDGEDDDYVEQAEFEDGGWDWDENNIGEAYIPQNPGFTPVQQAPTQQAPVQQQFTPVQQAPAQQPPVQYQPAPAQPAFTPMQPQQQYAGGPVPGFTPVNPQMQQPAAPPAQAYTPYPNNGMTASEAVMNTYAVYNKIFDHLFTHCGLPFMFPEVDSLPEGGTIPMCSHNAWRQAIPLTPSECAVVVKSDCLDASGAYRAGLSTENGELRGHVTKSIKLPMYRLYLNINGAECCRAVLPQNPQTQSKDAKLALTGQRIMWVKEGNDGPNGEKAKFVCKRVENTWFKPGATAYEWVPSMRLENGTWVQC